jgi:hypothetical protein
MEGMRETSTKKTKKSSGCQAIPRTLFLVCLLFSAATAHAYEPIPEQVETWTIMEQVGVAAVSWTIDQGFRTSTSLTPAPLPLDCGDQQVDITQVPLITADDLELLLVPMYLNALPRLDGWGQPLEFRLVQTASMTPFLVIRSAGADLTFEGDLYQTGAVDSATEDLVLVDGYGVRALPPSPASAQLITFLAMSDLGTALMAWVTDLVARRETIPQPARSSTLDISLFTPITVAALRDILVPTYTNCVPATDGWGHTIEYFLDQTDILATELFAIRSTGSDGTFDGTVYAPGSFPGWQREHDLVWADGYWVRWPEIDIAFGDDFESGDVGLWSLLSQ